MGPSRWPQALLPGLVCPAGVHDAATAATRGVGEHALLALVVRKGEVGSFRMYQRGRVRQPVE